MDWASDPELQKLRNDFVDSFAGRRNLLAREQLRLQIPEEVASSLKSIQSLSHKLAGAAESYGFVALTQVAGALDDQLDGSMDPALVTEYVALLVEMLSAALQSKEDPVEFANDSRFKRLLRII